MCSKLEGVLQAEYQALPQAGWTLGPLKHSMPWTASRRYTSDTAVTVTTVFAFLHPISSHTVNTYVMQLASIGYSNF